LLDNNIGDENSKKYFCLWIIRRPECNMIGNLRKKSMMNKRKMTTSEGFISLIEKKMKFIYPDQKKKKRSPSRFQLRWTRDIVQSILPFGYNQYLSMQISLTLRLLLFFVMWNYRFLFPISCFHNFRAKHWHKKSLKVNNFA